MIQPELQARIEKLKNLIDSGVVDSERAESGTPPAPEDVLWLFNDKQTTTSRRHVLLLFSPRLTLYLFQNIS